MICRFSVVFIGYLIRNLVDVIGLIGEIGLEFLSTSEYAVFKSFGKAAFFEGLQHQILDIVPKTISHHLVDAFVAEDGELAVFDGQIDEHTVAKFGLIELQAFEDKETALLHIAFAVVLDMHFDLPRGVVFGLFDGLHHTAVFFSV